MASVIVGGAQNDFIITVENWADVPRGFLELVAETKSRGDYIDIYQLTPYSLMTSASYGITADVIIQNLTQLARRALDDSVVEFVRKYVNADMRVYVIVSCRVERAGDDGATTTSRCVYLRFPSFDIKMIAWDIEDVRMSVRRRVGVDDLLCEIDHTHLIEIKAALSAKGLMVIEEYDYHNDTFIAPIPCRLHLPRGVELRHYQIAALERIFHQRRARSGVIVLPCGAGKTLTGIAAACELGKSVIILCNNTTACNQWIQQWSRYVGETSASLLMQFTAKMTPDLSIINDHSRGVVLATTYSILAMQDVRRREDGYSAIQAIRRRTWGMALLDEVHLAPADSFRATLNHIMCMVKVGLTATLVREDGQIEDINYIVGPKLYEADWQSLTKQGYLAKVNCYHVVCPFSEYFMREYLGADCDGVAKGDPILYEMNPNKLETARILMEYHEKRGDKILIMADRIQVVEFFGTKYHRYMILGKTSIEEREELFEKFRANKIQTLIMTRVGDIAVDLPNANVLIQISAQGASRRQETQRVGRVMRAYGDKQSYFYSLVTQHTPEEHYSYLRFSYLADQGYAYAPLPWSSITNTTSDLHTEEEQIEYLTIVSKHLRS